MKKSFRLIGLLLVMSLTLTLSAQTPVDTTSLPAATSPAPAPKEKPDLRANLNESGTHYIKFTMLVQAWTRYNESNPGTTVNGHPEASTFDIGIRRARFQLIGQLTDRVFFYAQFGMNNYSYLASRKAGFFIHDVTAEYAFVPKKFSIGMGLSSWTAPLRFSAPSVGSIMGYDAPIFEQATNDISDQFVRKLGVYAKGKFGKFDYRINVAKPLIVNYGGTTPANQAGVLNLNQVPAGVATFSPWAPKMQYNGYFMYQFKDIEDNTVPYMTGTYLGKKNVFNIGAGGIYQQDAVWSRSAAGDTSMAALWMVGVDAYYDVAINKDKGTALNAYAGYLYSNYGPNYVRNLGVMNPADPNLPNSNAGGYNTTTGAYNSGGGTAFGMNGTGNTVYGQVGFKFKNDLLKSFGTLMPYVMSQVSSYERYNGTMYTWDIGINWFLKGHTSKFTLDYGNRPVFAQATTADPIKQTARRSCVVLQYQVSF